MSEVPFSRDIERNASVMEATKKLAQAREDLLNKDVSQLEKKDLARYLVTLIQEVNSAKKENHEKLSSLWQKIPWLQERFKTIAEISKTTERTKWLMEQMNLALQELKQSIETTVPLEYQKLQYELTESQIDDATNNMESILWSDASVITIWVGKYKQAWSGDLRGTIPDVQAVNEKLKDYNSPRQMSLLDEAATKEAILNAIKNAPPDKWLFLYFAWHGVDGHIMPYSTDSLVDKNDFRLDKCISPKELFEAIGNRKAMVIVDKCFGWNLTLAAPPNITIVSSTDSVHMAWEEGQLSKERNAGALKVREETITSKGTKVVSRWVATYGMTDTGKRWLDLHWFTNSANNKSQNPTIKS